MPEFDPTNTEGSDARANSEAVKLAAGDDLEVDGKKREHTRHQKFRDHANRAILILFWLVVSAIAIGLVTYTFHLVTPEWLHYLNPTQLEKLQTILVSALLSSALTGYAKHRLSS
jgi:hypothetical protein